MHIDGSISQGYRKRLRVAHHSAKARNSWGLVNDVGTDIADTWVENVSKTCLKFRHLLDTFGMVDMFPKCVQNVSVSTSLASPNSQLVVWGGIGKSEEITRKQYSNWMDGGSIRRL